MRNICVPLLVGIVLASTLSFARPTANQANSPKEVVEQFWKLEIAGAWLTPDGWNRMAALLAQPGAPPHDRPVAVIITGKNDYKVGEPAVANDKAEVYVGFLDPGKIDSALRFIPKPQRTSGGALVGPSSDGYELVLTNTHWKIGPNGTFSSETTSPPEWRIQTLPKQLHLGVEAAIRYVTDARDKTNDPSIRKNADRTIQILNQMR